MGGVEVSVMACFISSCVFGLRFGVLGLIDFVVQHTLPCLAFYHRVHNETRVAD